ncbi:NmrA/HSCARG family protein [Bradyrhizobium sp. 956_D2_N1_5]|uniref:NmrA/HSCARG family protein n=1 Tax=unclassified Bradyrhizobium TaxID=2631580 RepID=UPI003F28531D
MTKTVPVVLVVGATGKFARLVIPELLRRNSIVRALVRDAERGKVARLGGAAQIAIGDLRNAESLNKAAEGVDGIFHIGPAFAPDEAAMGVALVEAGERAGVRKFVFSSVIQPTNTGLKNHASKIPVEDALYSSRLNYTILHPANFMQNIGFAWPTILREGKFAEPFPKEKRIARVDYRDVAEIAATALTDSKLDYATLELCAGMFSRIDIVSIMSRKLGRPVTAEEPNFEEWAKVTRLPYDDHQLELLSKVHNHYRQYGLGGNSLLLSAALGREPRSMEQYIGDLVHQSASENPAEASNV